MFRARENSSVQLYFRGCQASWDPSCAQRQSQKLVAVRSLHEFLECFDGIPVGEERTKSIFYIANGHRVSYQCDANKNI